MIADKLYHQWHDTADIHGGTTYPLEATYKKLCAVLKMPPIPLPQDVLAYSW